VELCRQERAPERKRYEKRQQGVIDVKSPKLGRGYPNGSGTVGKGYLIGAKINGDQPSLRYHERMCIDEQSRMRPAGYGLALRSGNQGRSRDQVTLPTLPAIGSKIIIFRQDEMNAVPVVIDSLAPGHCGDRCGATACFQPRLASIHLTHIG
jgi:hypothetical protein